MKYIILCGGQYKRWKAPRQLCSINGEMIIKRTIRLLRECGVEDIAIASEYSVFDNFGVKRINHRNTWVEDTCGQWVEAFPLVGYPVCYILGDVVFTKQAIRAIVETETDDVEFFASCPPFHKDYIKPWAEPFAFKVVNNEHFADAVKKLRQDFNKFDREPISWELWQEIKGTELNKIDYSNYIAINDITCDIDKPEDVVKLQKVWDKWIDT